MDFIIKSYHNIIDIYCKCFFDGYQIWFLSILSSGLVGLTGILPMLIIPLNGDNYLSCQSKRLRLLLSFAVGSLLGDVFLHLLPEAYRLSLKLGVSPHSTYNSLGVWVLSGIFTFFIVEVIFNTNNNKVFSDKTLNNCISIPSKNIDSSDHQIFNDSNFRNKVNNCCSLNEDIQESAKSKTIETIGYLNLLANGIDNFSHGLAVAASFIAGVKIGFLTTFAIIIHEIPHEFGDFAILMKSGFSKWDAMKAQLSTASIGIFGAIFALSFDHVNKAKIQTWILPFTCGGFINIAMVNILPQLLREDDPWESIKQSIFIGCGVGVMAIINCFND